MNHRYIEQSPKNVIWRNLSLNPYEQNLRQVASLALSVGLIVAWTFPGEFALQQCGKSGLILVQWPSLVLCPVSTR